MRAGHSFDKLLFGPFLFDVNSADLLSGTATVDTWKLFQSHHLGAAMMEKQSLPPGFSFLRPTANIKIALFFPQHILTSSTEELADSIFGPGKSRVGPRGSYTDCNLTFFCKATLFRDLQNDVFAFKALGFVTVILWKGAVVEHFEEDLPEQDFEEQGFSIPVDGAMRDLLKDSSRLARVSKRLPLQLG